MYKYLQIIGEQAKYMVGTMYYPLKPQRIALATYEALKTKLGNKFEEVFTEIDPQVIEAAQKAKEELRDKLLTPFSEQPYQYKRWLEKYNQLLEANYDKLNDPEFYNWLRDWARQFGKIKNKILIDEFLLAKKQANQINTNGVSYGFISQRKQG